MTKEEINDLQKYILNLIQNRKNIGQEPTGDDLHAVLGHLEILKESQLSLPSNVDEAAWKYGIDNQMGIATQSEKVNAFKAGIEWRDNNLWHPANGDDLPELEREVVVFTQNIPNDLGIMKVCIAHRPNPNGWDGRNILTGEVNHYTPKTYDKGGWSIPDVVYWLDANFPCKEDEV